MNTSDSSFIGCQNLITILCFQNGWTHIFNLFLHKYVNIVKIKSGSLIFSEQTNSTHDKKCINDPYYPRWVDLEGFSIGRVSEDELRGYFIKIS